MIGYVQMYIDRYRKVRYRCSECRKDVNETTIRCPYCGILLIGDGD